MELERQLAALVAETEYVNLAMDLDRARAEYKRTGEGKDKVRELAARINDARRDLRMGERRAAMNIEPAPPKKRGFLARLFGGEA